MYHSSFERTPDSLANIRYINRTKFRNFDYDFYQVTVLMFEYDINIADKHPGLDWLDWNTL